MNCDFIVSTNLRMCFVPIYSLIIVVYRHVVKHTKAATHTAYNGDVNGHDACHDLVLH